MSKSALKDFKAWHKSKTGLFIFGVLELGIAYGLGSRALDTGSWWEYGLALLFLIGGIQNVVRLMKKVISGKSKTNKA